MDKRLEEFKKVRSVLIRSLNDFPKEKRGEVLFGRWSLKDVVAHLSGWMLAAAKNVKSLKEGQTPPWVESIDKFNQDNVEKRRGWGWERPHQELIELRHWRDSHQPQLTKFINN